MPVYTPRQDCQIPSIGAIYGEYFQQATGRFVEVGACTGVTTSNTVFLAEAGWTGIYIEPYPEAAALCAFNHKQHQSITTVVTAVSDCVGAADLYLIGDCSTLVWDKTAADWGGDKNKKITVKTTTLDLLLAELKWEPSFDLLVIDVEQSELRVLSGFDIGRWQPRMVIIEAHEKDAAAERNWKAGPINAWFSARSYRKIYADHINSIFVL